MTIPESASGDESAFGWKTYAVKRSDKAPLLAFIEEALVMRGCRIVSTTDHGQAPFYIVFESPAGERQGVLAYAFFANTKPTRNRPEDEHRFQIKYGGELKGVLDVAVDPHALITTIFLGIDPERKIFIAADPLMNAPSPMSRSIEFKAEHVETILAQSWFAWERDRRPPKTKDRPTPEIDADTRIQILVGGVQERLFDLIVLERLARGLDPGERHLLADQLRQRADLKQAASISHKLLDELGLPPEALFDLIDGAARLKMAVRGWVAEQHLETALRVIPGVTECKRIELDGQPDITLRWKGGKPLLIECKNVLRKTDRHGNARIDFQRTRASKGDPCSRYYAASEFSILAASLHAVREKWEFAFAPTSALARHATCVGKLANSVIVSQPLFTSQPETVFGQCSES